MKFWYRTQVIGKDGTSQIVVKWMPQATKVYPFWRSEGLIGPFESELEAIDDYLKHNEQACVALLPPDGQDDCATLRNQLVIARTTQDQLRDELTAVTAKRDELKAAQQSWTALRREIWEMVQQADCDNPLANALEALLK